MTERQRDNGTVRIAQRGEGPRHCLRRNYEGRNSVLRPLNHDAMGRQLTFYGGE